MEPYFKLVVVDDDEVAKVKDDVAPANTCTNNTNSLDKEDLLCTQLQLLAILLSKNVLVQPLKFSLKSCLAHCYLHIEPVP